MSDLHRGFPDVNSQVTSDTTFGFLNHAQASAQLFHPKLIANDDSNTMLAALLAELRRSHAFVFSVAFVTPGAIALLKQSLLDFEGKGTIITSTYLGFNSPDSFKELNNLPSNITTLLFDPKRDFHPKGYVFEQPEGSTAIIGSSNLSRAALLKTKEWNLRFSALPDGDILRQIERELDGQTRQAVPLTPEWVYAYEQTYVAPPRRSVPVPSVEVLEHQFQLPDAIRPNSMQEAALTEIQKVREAGASRAIVVSATGTGKTILAALDVRAFQPRRMLFVVHREQILDRAMSEFKRVLAVPDHEFGKFVGSQRELDRRFVFATIQSISREEHLSSIPKDHFDYVLIDEVHRAGADSYQRLAEHFRPSFLFGFTATPERSDDFNVFEMFDFNVPYEIRLQEALERDMLVPFHYYGVADYTTSSGEVVTDTSSLAKLVMPERISHLLLTIETYGQAGDDVKGLVFCSGVDEARALSSLLNERTLRGKHLRTRALTGEDSVELREASVRELERGDLDYLITVDIFNEGVDIPAVNQIVMMRQTQSSIVFTQQLGRGLRKSLGKEHLIVIDFIGNYANNFLIPIALFGDTSLNKDSVRKHLIDSEESGVISGVSSISFDRVSRQRVFESLARTKLDSMAALKKTFRDLEFRLGHAPKLLDFARFDSADPVIVATRKEHYWGLLHAFKAVTSQPAPHEAAFLKFLSSELLSGKRPHELILIRALLRDAHLSNDEVVAELERHQCTSSPEVISGLQRIFNLEFFVSPDQKKYGSTPIAVSDRGAFSLNDQIGASYLTHEEFRSHVDDAIETGLYLARHKHAWNQSLTVGDRYSKKEICRLLNWVSDQKGTMYGYKVDKFSNSCPIFVTYHKDEDVSASTQYGDTLLNESTLLWYTRSRRTLASKQERSIANNEVPIHLFVKKDDAEGIEFYYLGQAQASGAQETTMPGDDGAPLPVVTMNLHLQKPLEPHIYDYLVSPGITLEMD